MKQLRLFIHFDDDAPGQFACIPIACIERDAPGGDEMAQQLLAALDDCSVATLSFAKSKNAAKDKPEFKFVCYFLPVWDEDELARMSAIVGACAAIVLDQHEDYLEPVH